MGSHTFNSEYYLQIKLFLNLEFLWSSAFAGHAMVVRWLQMPKIYSSNHVLFHSSWIHCIFEKKKSPVIFSIWGYQALLGMI